MLINKFQKELNKYGIKASIDQIRKLERRGIVFSIRNPKNNYREYEDSCLDESLRNVFLYYFGTPIEDIKSNNKEVINNHLARIIKATKYLKSHAE